MKQVDDFSCIIEKEEISLLLDAIKTAMTLFRLINLPILDERILQLQTIYKKIESSMEKSFQEDWSRGW